MASKSSSGRVPWKSRLSLERRRRIGWPSAAQLFRQVIVVGVGLALWSGLLSGFLRLTAPPADTLAAATPTHPPAATETSVPPTNTPTPRFTPSPTRTPTSTPTPTRIATDSGHLGSASPLEPTSTPSLTPTPTPSSTPTPTDTPTPTPPPPTDTPIPRPEAGDTGISFAGDVFPIFERRCIKCHGGEKPEGGLRIEEGLDMRSYEALMQGSFNGPVVEPGNADTSYLVELIMKGEMPKKEPRLLPGEIRTIVDWINAGAPDN